MACEHQLSIDSPGFEQKLVVNGFVNDQEKFKLTLGQNSTLLDEPYSKSDVGQTRLIVSEDGFIIHDKEYDVWNGILQTNLTISLSHTYQIVLESEKLGTVSASDRMPDMAPDFELDSLHDYGQIKRLHFTIQDHVIDEYYMLELFVSGYRVVSGDTIREQLLLPFTSSDKLFLSNINGFRSSSYIALFHDKLLMGTYREIELSIKAEDLNPSGFTSESIDMRIRSMSPDYFDYMQEILENNHVFGGPLASPRLSQSNIEGGLGVFGCYTFREKELQL